MRTVGPDVFLPDGHIGLDQVQDPAAGLEAGLAMGGDDIDAVFIGVSSKPAADPIDLDGVIDVESADDHSPDSE